MYKIGEFSRLSQLPIRTLRYYDQIGLLVPAQIERPSGYRGYAADQLERVNRILVLKDLGLSLDEIRAVLVDHASAEDIRALVRRKHADLARRVDAERRRLARAAARLDLMERGGAALADIAVRDVGACWVASVRATLRSHDDCDALFDQLDHHFTRHAGRSRERRQRGAIWHACTADTIDCEAYEIIPGRIATRGGITVRQLPAHQVAALVYHGDSDYLPAYRAMRTWIASSGLEITGPKHELYLRSVESVTEIQFPIERKADHARITPAVHHHDDPASRVRSRSHAIRRAPAHPRVRR
jgi:DNA-binding transcriptional MerR regulator